MSGTDFFDEDLVQRRGSGKSSSLGQATDIVGAARHDEIPSRPVSDLNLTRMTKHREEVNTQVATAKVEIERLRQRQTELEREKQALEDLSQKQEQYERGRQEMLDRLAESLITLERLEDQVTRLTQIYAGARQRHAEILAELQAINDSEWADENLRDELNKALVLINNARKEFVKSQAAVEAAGGPASLTDPSLRAGSATGPAAAGLSADFGTWLKIGFAMSLPLLIIALVVLGVILFGRGGH